MNNKIIYLILKVCKKLNFLKFLSLFFNKKKQKRLENHNFTIISSNCNGGCIYHDLNEYFRSPFINLWIKPKDYIKLLKNLELYMHEELIFIKEDDIPYPIGKLKDVVIYFQHYKNEAEAKKKWDERKKRINYDNIYILFTDRDGCCFEDLREFEKLPYKHKVVFTCKEYKEIKSSYYIKGFKNEVGILSEYKLFSWKRYLDDFDYVSFLNEK